MAYGGGKFMTQNKILPGAYVVFASVARASVTISDRGVAAAPFELSWGPEGEVLEVEQRDFVKDCMEIFGYPYTAPEMLPLREIFKHAIKCYCYRLPSSNAAKAQNPGDLIFAKAKYKGKRGNDICVQIEQIPKTTKYNVTTLVGGIKVDEQLSVEHFGDLRDNDYVEWLKGVTIEEDVYTAVPETETTPVEGTTYYTRSGEAGSYSYTEVAEPSSEGMSTYYTRSTVDVNYTFIFDDETLAGDTKVIADQITNLVGGADGDIDGDADENFLEAIEPYSFNTLCCPASDSVTIGTYVSFTKAQRDQVGARFQLVCYSPDSSTGADYEGVIGLWNKPKNADEAALTYWLTGAEAAAPINGSLTNTKYDGELEIEVDTKQSKLEDHIKKGHLVFHRSNGDIVILTDINSLVTLKEDFGSMFQKNQTIRFCDNLANDLAAHFVKRYLGIVQNDNSGRASWWNEVVKYLREAQRLRAITEFEDDIVTVDIGDEKDIVVTNINGLNIVNAMEKLYMTVICK